MAVVAFVMVTGLVAARVHRRRMALRAVVRGVDDLARLVVAWETEHRIRRRALDRHMTEIEGAIASAEDRARRAACRMNEANIALVGRMEQVEQRTELHVLVGQGRIPSEHLPR